MIVAARDHGLLGDQHRVVARRQGQSRDQEHARLEPAVGVGKVRPELDRPCHRVDARIDGDDLAGEGAVGIRGAPRLDGEAGSHVSERGRGDAEVDFDARGIIERGDHGARGDERADAHAPQPEATGERRANDVFAEPRLVGADTRLGRLECGEERVHPRLRDIAVLEQGACAVVELAGLVADRALLLEVGFELVGVELNEHVARNHPLSLGEADTFDDRGHFGRISLPPRWHVRCHRLDGECDGAAPRRDDLDGNRASAPRAGPSRCLTVIRSRARVVPRGPTRER